MEHFFSPNSGEDQKKKRSSPKMEHFFFPKFRYRPKENKVLTKHGTIFFPNSSGHLRSDAHQSQIFEGMQDLDYT